MDISQQILSDVVIFQKYAKHLPELGRRETWEEICERNMVMHIRKYPQLKEEIKRVYRQFVIPKKTLPSMRSMQFGGRPIELNNTRIFNCAYAPVDHPFIFAECMQLLLGGCFKEGTLVKTKNGDKPIEEITVFDEVMTYDEKMEEFRWVNPVWAGMTDTKDKRKVKITMSNGDVVYSTADHRFLTENGWVEAQNLKPEDNIVSTD